MENQEGCDEVKSTFNFPDDRVLLYGWDGCYKQITLVFATSK